MFRRALVIVLTAGAVIASSPVPSAHAPGRCPSDSKLLNGGPTVVFGGGPGSWWRLVLDGLVDAGFDTVPAQIAYLNQIFDTTYTSLAALEAYNEQLVADAWDENENGYVCAFELRGTRRYLGDPNVNDAYFGISDDRLGK